MMQMIVDMSEWREKNQLLELVRNLNGMHRVEIVKYRKRRTDRQNRMYWPAVVQPFADFLRAQGESYTDADAHELLKFKFLRQTIANIATGEVIGERVRSTTDLNVDEFSVYFDNCCQWLSEMFGIEVQSPEAFKCC